MAIIQHFRQRFMDYARMTIGDTDKVLFTDDEMKSPTWPLCSGLRRSSPITAVTGFNRAAGPSPAAAAGAAYTSSK